MKKKILATLFISALSINILTGCSDNSDDSAPTTHTHEYVDDTVVPPTCTEKGYTKKVCSICNDTTQTDFIEPLNHNYTDTIVAPTCTEKGYTKKVCSICNDTTQTDIVEALNHNYTDTIVAPTCTEKGYTNRVCSICNDTTQVDIVEALNHNYADTTVAPTCTGKGYTQRICSICNDTIILNEVAALNHSYNDIVVPATCQAQGYTEHSCSRCNNHYIDGYTDATGHSYNNGTTIAATKEQRGYTLYKCNNCTQEIKDNYTDFHPVPSQVYADMLALEAAYPSGMQWTNDNYYGWNGGVYSGGYGCAGFAFMLSDAAFGYLPARKHTDFSNIKVGDILRINGDTHSVIVLALNDSGVTVAEGNYGGRIHWYREISYETINEKGTYVMTRYPQ